MSGGGWERGGTTQQPRKPSLAQDSGTPAERPGSGRKPAGRVLKPGAVGNRLRPPWKYTQGPDVWDFANCLQR